MLLLALGLMVLGMLSLPGCRVRVEDPPTPVAPDGGDPTPQPIPHGVRVTDFYATWCVPCRHFKPIFESWEKKYSSPYISFREVDVDLNHQEARKYGVTSIPTVVLEVDGVVKKTWVGPPTEAEFLAVLKQFQK